MQRCGARRRTCPRWPASAWPRRRRSSGGSDGIDTAAKLARRYWQLAGETNKRIIISRDGAYHGLHGFGTSPAGISFNREGYGSESLIPETARVPLTTPTRSRRPSPTSAPTVSPPCSPSRWSAPAA